MSVKVQFSAPDKILSRLGMRPGGDNHRFFMRRAADRMKRYLPYRDKGRMVDKQTQGIRYDLGEFHYAGPEAAYLYFGKAMAGKPKKPIDKNLVYTKSPNANAGPFWDRAMMQNEGKALADETTEYMRRK